MLSRAETLAHNRIAAAHLRESDRAEQPLSDHLFEVARLAGHFASRAGLGHAGELVGLVHDFGKYSAEFQAYLRSAHGLIEQDADEYVDAERMRGKIDHSTAGAQLVWRHLSAHGGLGPLCGQLLALCVASHHSGLIDCIAAGDGAEFGTDVFSRRMAKAAEKTHLDEAETKADEAVTRRVRELLRSDELIAEIKTFAARTVKANQQAGNKPTHQQLGLLVRYLFSCLIDADRTNTGDFERSFTRGVGNQGGHSLWEELAGRLDSYLEGMPEGGRVNDLRREIGGDCLRAAERAPGIFTLTVPTGAGKTFSSLRFALHHAAKYGLDRIVYLVPFTSIIDQNAEAVRRVLETDGEEGRIVLEHHSNLTPERQGWRTSMLAENWDAPVVFTTMVQFLEALFGGGTRGARRMHRLAKSVLIFDEIQTLPLRCVHLFNNAINFLAEQCGSTVLLCTATQPLLHKVDSKKGAVRLADAPELAGDQQSIFDALKRVEVRNRVRPGGWTYAQTAELARRAMEESGSCLVVVNTKNAARQVYEHLKDLGAEQRIHLSTNMCPAHRKEKLREATLRLDANKPIVCVSTQLIEAGVDIDFASVVRSLAGLDSIAQAAGRCNRNGRRARGTVSIVNLGEEKLDRLPDIRMGQLAADRVMREAQIGAGGADADLFGPAAMALYYRYYFFEQAKTMDYPVKAKEGGLAQDDTVLNLLSENSGTRQEYETKRGNTAALNFRQAYMTAGKLFEAIDALTEGVIVPYNEGARRVRGELCAANDAKRQRTLMREAQQYTVALFPHVLAKLTERSAVHALREGLDVLHLDEQFYSKEYGVTGEGNEGMEDLYV